MIAVIAVVIAVIAVVIAVIAVTVRCVGGEHASIEVLLAYALTGSLQFAREFCGDVSRAESASEQLDDPLIEVHFGLVGSRSQRLARRPTRFSPRHSRAGSSTSASVPTSVSSNCFVSSRQTATRPSPPQMSAKSRSVRSKRFGDSKSTVGILDRPTPRSCSRRALPPSGQKAEEAEGSDDEPRRAQRPM